MLAPSHIHEHEIKRERNWLHTFTNPTDLLNIWWTSTKKRTQTGIEAMHFTLTLCFFKTSGSIKLLDWRWCAANFFFFDYYSDIHDLLGPVPSSFPSAHWPQGVMCLVLRLSQNALYVFNEWKVTFCDWINKKLCHYCSSSQPFPIRETLEIIKKVIAGSP